MQFRSISCNGYGYIIGFAFRKTGIIADVIAPEGLELKI
jgi:hypothetical protein